MVATTMQKLTMQAGPAEAFVADWATCGRAAQPTEDECADLAWSIFQDGQHTPGIVRLSGPNQNPTRTIVAGHRRWIAVGMINRGFNYAVNGEVVWVHDPEVLFKFTVAKVSAEEAFLLTISENVDRKDLTPIDLAVLARTGIDRYALSVNAMAERFRCSGGQVRRYLKLLTLSAEERDLVATGRVNMTTAVALADAPEADRYRLMQEAAASPAESRAAVQKVRQSSPVKLRRTVSELRKFMHGFELDGMVDSGRYDTLILALEFLDGDPDGEAKLTSWVNHQRWVG